jgi:hypothetical protein
MSLNRDKNQLLKTISFYEKYLKTLNGDVFFNPGLNNSWSYSQVYDHVLGVNKLCCIAIENCLNKTAPIKTSKTNWKVRVLLFFGILSFKKIKSPDFIAAQVNHIAKEEASNKLKKLRSKIESIYPEFKKYNPHYKIKHPLLGYLDAKLWLRFMLVHTKHHIKQLKRLEKYPQA